MPDLMIELNFYGINALSVLTRLLLAAFLGGILGFERTRKMRAAGLRTYMLVCIGSTTVMMTGQFASVHLGTGDPTRMAAQVISGIGFLGAGTIVITGYHRVRGLTTAAGLWLSACLGLAIGIGFYFGAIAMMVVAMLSIIIGEAFQRRYMSGANRLQLYILFETGDCVKDYLVRLKKQGIIVTDFTYMGALGSSVSASFSLKLQHNFKHKDVLEQLDSIPEVLFYEEV